MKQLRKVFSVCVFMLTGMTTTMAQSPIFTEDFESGSSTLSSWVLVNDNGAGGSVQTNKWVIGSGGQSNATDAAFISNDGSTHAYTTSPSSATSVAHLYYDLTGLTNGKTYKLSFRQIGDGESCCDYLRVYLVNSSSVTPVAGSLLSYSTGDGEQLGSNYNLRSSWEPTSIAFTAGTNTRLVFSWRNDASVGTNPPAAIDDVSIEELPAANQTETIALTEAGTLGTTLDFAATKYLTITGDIDARDIKFIRDNMPLLETLDLSGATIVEHTGNDGTNPSGWGAYTYAAGTLPDYSFYNPSLYTVNTTLTSVVLPPSLTSIGLFAFNGCTGLAGDLTIPAGVTNIGYSAFSGCTNLNGTLTLPANLNEISDEAFNNTPFTAITSLSLTPPTIYTNTFSVDATNCVLTVSTSSVAAYIAANYWDAFQSTMGGNTIQGDGFVFSATANNSAFGSIDVGSTANGLYAASTSISVTATAESGYTFLSWTSNGVVISTTAALAFTLSRDTVLVAKFGKPLTENLLTAGTLKDITDIETVTHLTLTGDIDASDIKFMRDYMTELTELDLSGATIVEYNGDAGTYPSGWGTYTYAAGTLPDYSFYNPWGSGPKFSLTSVKLPTSLLQIGNYAFQDCSNLAGTLTIPNGVESIGWSAFSNCSSLTGMLTLPEGLTIVNDNTFQGCSSLSGLVLPSTLTNIGGYAFQNCNGLTGNLIIPNGVEDIGQSAFAYCSSLTGTLTLPEGLTIVNDNTFQGCSSLTHLVLPESLTTIGQQAFYGCLALTDTLTLHANVASIGDYAFDACDNLGVIVNLRRSPISLPTDAFSTTTYANAKLIVATSSVADYQAADYWSLFITTVGGGFSVSVSENDSRLGTVSKIPSKFYDSGTSITVTATANSDVSFRNWTDGGVVILTNPTNPTLSHIISQDVVLMANFRDTANVTVTTAGTLAANLPSWEAIKHLTVSGNIDARDIRFIRDSVSGKNPVGGVILEVLDLSAATIAEYTGSRGTRYPSLWNDYTYPANEMPQNAFYDDSYHPGYTYVYNPPTHTIILPTTLVSIGESAFRQNSNLIGTFTIPASVTSFGDYAFTNCNNIASIVLPSTLKTIGNSAFASCSSISSLTLPAGIISIGQSAFNNCDGLTAVTNLNPTPVNLSEDAFSSTAYTNAQLTVPGGSLALYTDGSDDNKNWYRFGSSGATIVETPLRSLVATPNNIALGNITGLEDKFYADGESVTLTAHPNSDVRFRNWTSYGDVVSTSPTLTISLTQDTILVANFTNEATVTATAGNLVSLLPSALGLKKITVSGTIDARDVKFLRDNTPLLTTLDLSAATIVEYTGTAGTAGSSNITYPANELPQFSFYDDNTGQSKTSLTSVKLPTNLLTIGNNAFYYCENLAGTLTLPTGLTSIGNSAFNYCEKLTGTLTLPAGLTTIGEGAFMDCSGFTGTLMLPLSLTAIGEAAFAFNSGFTGSLTLPANIASVGNYAFYGCGGFTGALTLPAALNTIGYSAFYECSGFTSITNYNPLPVEIDESAFYGFNKANVTLTVPNASVALYRATDVWKDFMNTAGPTPSGFGLSVSVNSDLLGAVSGAENKFYTSGQTATLTATPKLGVGFLNWTGKNSGIELSTALTLTVTLTKDTAIVANFGTTGNYSSGAGTLNTIPNAATLTSLTVSGNIDARDVKFMRDNMPLLRELDLSAATIVAYSGTAGTAPAGSIHYPANEMPQYSFYDDNTGQSKTSLVAVQLPTNLLTIGEAAFRDCYGLTGTLTLPASLTSIGADAFAYTSITGNLTLPNGITTIGNNAFQGCSWLNGTLTLPANLVTLGSYAFYKTGIKGSLTLPAGLTSIDNSTFADCYNLTGTLTLPTDLTYIDNDAFQYTPFTGTLTLPAGLSYIGRNAFGGAKFSGTLNLPANLNYIGDNAFRDATFSGDLVLPDGISSVEWDAFIASSFTRIINLNAYAVGEYAFNTATKNTATLILPLADARNLYFSSYSDFKNIWGWDSVGTNVVYAAPNNYALGEVSTDSKTATSITLKYTQHALVGFQNWTKDGAALGMAATIMHNVTANGAQIVANFGNTLRTVDLGTNSGTLADTLSATANTITHLKVTGEIDARDVKFLRDSMDYLAELDLSEATVVEYTGTAGTEMYGVGPRTYPANEMPLHSFINKSSLTKVQLPSGLTSIGDYAFFMCSNLTGVLSLPSGVTNIGEGAFIDCSSLSGALTLPSGLKTIGNQAFTNCTGLSGALTIPSGLTYLGSSAFQNCTGFSGALTLSDSLTIIYANTFEGCTGLSGTLTLPASLRYIENYAFSGCTGFSGSLTIPVGVTDVLYSAFSGCTGLNGTLTLPAGLIHILDYAFYGAKFTHIVNLRATPQDISYDVFSVAANACTLTVPNGSESLYQTAYRWKDFWNSSEGGLSVTVVVANDDPSWGSISGVENRFYTAGETLTLTATPKAPYSFIRWIGITEETISTANPLIVELDRDTILGAYFGIEKTIASTGANSLQALLTTPTDLTGTTNLKVTGNIDARDIKFLRDDMPALEELDLSEATIVAYTGTNGTAPSGRGSVTYPLNEMPEWSFHNFDMYGPKTSLTSVQLPTNLTAIGDYAFLSCDGLRRKMLALPAGLLKIGDAAFSDARIYDALVLPIGLTTLGNNAFANNYFRGNLSIPASLTSTGDAAFQNAGFDEGTLTLPEGTTSIANNAFEGTGFSDVVWPSTLVDIGDDAFSGSGLTTLTLPDGLVTIGVSAFSNCNQLKSLYLPASVTSIGNNAFAYPSLYGPLASVINRSTVPQVITSNVFYNVNYATCALSVPSASKKDYQKAIGWQNWFANGTDDDNIIGGDWALFYASNNTGWGTVAGTVGTGPGGETVSGLLHKANVPILLTATASYGKHFVNWTDKNTGAVRSTDAEWAFPITTDLSLVANFAENVYDVTFVGDTFTGDIVTQHITHGGRATKPPVPSRRYYQSVDWLNEADGNTVWNFNSAVTNSLTLTAHWKPIFSGWAISGAEEVTPFDPAVSEYSLMIPCDSDDNTVTIQMINSSDSVIFDENVVVTGGNGVVHVDADGKMVTTVLTFVKGDSVYAYTFHVTRPFRGAIKQFWNDVVAVDQSYETQNGNDYTFTSYEWLKGSETLASGPKSYYYFETPPSSTDEISVNITVSDGTGSEALIAVCPSTLVTKANSLLVYPNPVVSSSLTVTNTQWPDVSLIELYTINGELINTIRSSSVETTVNVSTYSRGIYIVKMGKESAKIIVE
ncbi:hypothetical protein FACS1894199_12460 [Bacteroidia bacterium]|nr:hypothetical protein FACS1894199_12460 [Bacteroidia bacterium]